MDKKLFETAKDSVYQLFTKIIRSKYTSRILLLLVLSVLMFLPFSMTSIDLLNPDVQPKVLYPFTAIFDPQVKAFPVLYGLCFFLYLLPITFILTVVSFFVEKITQKHIYITAFVTCSFYLMCIVCGVIHFATTPRWFFSLEKLVYFAFFLAIFFHIFFVIIGVVAIRSLNESQMEYRSLLLESEKRKKELSKKKQARAKKRKEVVEQDTQEQSGFKVADIVEKYTSKLNQYGETILKAKIPIKVKISAVIIVTILIILLTFIYTDLRNYKNILSQTVNSTGANLSEQTAEIYTYSDGLNAKISSYLEGLKKTNSSASFPAHRVDIITTSNRDFVPIEEITSNTTLPDYDVFSYTTATGKVREIPEREKSISSGEALKYFMHNKNPQTSKNPIYDKESDSYNYVHPITIIQKDVEKLVGFSVVKYKKEILDKPYFQSKVFVIAISLAFFYFAVIVAIFLSDFIANPVIFLCGSVKKTSIALDEMLSESGHIETNKLKFDDSVWTNDEVKDLSSEIKYMVSLVKGMLPYVSFSTIQSAEKTVKRQATSRNLCFLFTDVRGFTDMCENMPAKDVVPILNRYLDIETKIIFENEGDVDKYIGDAVMAFFSGPRKEINACRAAMQIRRAIRQEQQNLSSDARSNISIGIGINTGEVVFGSIGSKNRKDFTSIGDTVNLASRLESANKEYGSKSIISEEVYNKLHGSFVCRELDFIQVKGKKEARRIFEILQTVEDASDKLYDIKELFEEGLKYYRLRKWDKAESYFTECKDKYNDLPSKVFLRRIAHYREKPPKHGWKGVYVMSTK